MARDINEQRSRERKDEVNCTLARHADTISGGRFPRGVAVDVKSTAKTTSLTITDAAGNDLLAVLNQGELNALSIAILLAQAEATARSGGFSFVLLDDPCQSLDEVHQNGLADALGAISSTCRVLCGATPSRFVERVRDFVAEPRKFVIVEQREGEGAAVKEVYEL